MSAIKPQHVHCLNPHTPQWRGTGIDTWRSMSVRLRRQISGQPLAGLNLATFTAQMLPGTAALTKASPNFHSGRRAIKPDRVPVHIAGLYLLSECLRLGDRPVVIRGDGVGVTRLIWTANAASSGACASGTESRQDA